MVKKIFLSLFLFGFICASAQYSNDNRNVWIKGKLKVSDSVNVLGQLSIIPNAGAGKVLTSNATGQATWQTASGGSNIYNSNGTITDQQRRVEFDPTSQKISFGDTAANQVFGIGDILSDGKNGLYFGGDVVSITANFPNGDDAGVSCADLGGANNYGSSITHTDSTNDLRTAVFVWKDASNLERGELFIQSASGGYDLVQWEVNTSNIHGRYYRNPGDNDLSYGFHADSNFVSMFYNSDIDGAGTNANGSAWNLSNEGVTFYNGSDSIFRVDNAGEVTIKDGTQGANKVFTSDANGNGHWGNVVTSGWYIPDTANAIESEYDMDTAYYSVNGNYVTVTGYFRLIGASGSPTTVEITMPPGYVWNCTNTDIVGQAWVYAGNPATESRFVIFSNSNDNTGVFWLSSANSAAGDSDAHFYQITYYIR